MYILAADNEQHWLDALVTALQTVFPQAHIHGETDALQAMEWVKRLAEEGQGPAYAFMEIRLDGMDGLELARQIKVIHPDTKLVFCTAYKEYAFDAFGLYAKGYLLKPVHAEAITGMLDEMVHDWRKETKAPACDIRIQTFGHFTVFVDQQPVSFSRGKAKELLAYLVDCHGAAVTTKQIASVLWEDRPYDRNMKNYVATVVKALKSALRDVGAQDILIKTHNQLSVDIGKFQCDAYDYETGDAAAINAFRGEYMIEYSWAEIANAKYIRMGQERIQKKEG